MQMSDSLQKILFFIKSPASNLTAIELYLKKRGFQVISESDLKKAILEVTRIKPDYIFIAWDHPNDRVVNLPKLILQSMMTTIITYCTSNNKIYIRKLQSSGQTHKLFPPLSGPAIQRLILKIEKDILSANDLYAKKTTGYSDSKNSSDLIQIRFDDKNIELDQFIHSLNDSVQMPSEIYIDKGRRAQELRNKQNITKKANITALTLAQDIASSTEFKMTESVKSKLSLKFEEQIRQSLEDMIETIVESTQNSDFSHQKNEALNKTTTGFCSVIEHKSLTGYLIIASENILDPAGLENIFTKWILENISEDIDEDSTLENYFDITFPVVSFEDFSEKCADFNKIILVSNKKTIFSFFALSPKIISLQLHELHDMFEILATEVPLSRPLPFDLHLYLPENKKFILYTKKDSLVTESQIEKLKDRKVEKVYSSLEYENSIQKNRAEKRIEIMIKQYKDGQN